MIILVARIPEEGSHYEGSDPGSILQCEESRFVRNVGEVAYRLYAQVVSGELIVSGELSAGMELRCGRCSDFFSTTVAVSDFLRAYSAPEGTDSVDITEDLREEMLLHVPAFAVCGEGCKGVCPQCGANLNEGACACAAKDKPSAWSALDGLDL